MTVEHLTPQQRQIRMNVRNFLMVATYEELAKEFALSVVRNDMFRAACISELIKEKANDTVSVQ